MKEIPKSGVLEGGSRAHARLMYLLGIKQLIVCINKMGDRSVDYKEARFLELAKDTRQMLIEVRRVYPEPGLIRCWCRLAGRKLSWRAACTLFP